MTDLQASWNFSFGVERSRIGDVGDIEIWDEAEHTLLLLLLDLLLRHFDLRDLDPHFGHGGGNSSA